MILYGHDTLQDLTQPYPSCSVSGCNAKSIGYGKTKEGEKDYYCRDHWSYVNNPYYTESILHDD